MIHTTPAIERLTIPASDIDLHELAQLLVDAVDSGAAVSFVAPLSVERAEQWWRTTISTAHARSIFLIARDATGIAGTVQLHPSWAPNQPHRAEVVKLMVHRRARVAGLGRRLMESLEHAARSAGFELLTLDARRAGVADHLYQRLGWTRVGVIPRYAMNPDGQAWHDTVIYYKDLRPLEDRG